MKMSWVCRQLGMSEYALAGLQHWHFEAGESLVGREKRVEPVGPACGMY